MTPLRIWLVGTGTVGTWLAGPLGSISLPCPPRRGAAGRRRAGSGPLAEHDRGDFPAPRLDNGVSWPWAQGPGVRRV
jgi:hypothetical protein